MCVCFNVHCPNKHVLSTVKLLRHGGGWSSIILGPAKSVVMSEKSQFYVSSSHSFWGAVVSLVEYLSLKFLIILLPLRTSRKFVCSSSTSYINDYLAVDSSGYWRTKSSRSICSVADSP